MPYDPLLSLYITHNPADAILRSLQDSLAVISVELTPIYEKLVTTRRQLVALAAKEGSHKAELKPIQEELRKIDSLSALFNLQALLPCLLWNVLNPGDDL